MNTNYSDFFSIFILAVIMLANLFSCAIHFQSKDFPSVIFNLIIALISFFALLSLIKKPIKKKL